MLPAPNTVINLQINSTFLFATNNFTTHQVSTSIDPNAPRLFLFEYEGNTLSWKPDFDKDKQKWSMHFAKAKRTIKKQFKSVNLTATPATYASENIIDGDDIKDYNNGILTKDNIEFYWQKLKDSDKSTTMKFTVGKSSTSVVTTTATVTIKSNQKSATTNDSKQQESYDESKEKEQENMLIVARKEKMDPRMQQQKLLDEKSRELEKLTQENTAQERANYQMARCSAELGVRKVLREANDRWKEVAPSLNVLDNLRGSSTAITRDNDTLLTGLQASLVNIMKTRWDIQSSLVIVRSIMRLNPGNEDSTAWNTIIATCEQIEGVARNALKSSLEVAGGLLLFRDALTKVEARAQDMDESDDLQIVLYPLTDALTKLDKYVGNSNAICTGFADKVNASVTKLRQALPGSSEEFIRLREVIEEIQAETDRMIIDRKETSVPLQKAEMEFNSLLLELIPTDVDDPECATIVRRWHNQRRAQENAKRVNKKIAIEDSKNRTKKNQENDKKVDKEATVEDSKNCVKKNQDNDKKVDKEITIEDLKNCVKKNEKIFKKKCANAKEKIDKNMSDEKISKEVEQIFEFRYRELGSREESLESQKEDLLSQKKAFEQMQQLASNAQSSEMKALRKSLEKKMEDLSNKKFQDTPMCSALNSSIGKANDEITRLGNRAANASNYRTVEYRETHYRECSETTGMWWWEETRTWEEPYDVWSTKEEYTGEKDTYVQLQKDEKDRLKNLQTQLRDEEKNFHERIKNATETAKKNNEIFREQATTDTQSMVKECDDKIKSIEKELKKVSQNQRELAKEHKKLDKNKQTAIKKKQKDRQTKKDNLDKTCKNEIAENNKKLEEINTKWNALRESRKAFDDFREACDAKIAQLEEKKKEYEEKQDKFKMSERGLLQLMQMAPFLISDAQEAGNQADKMGVKLNSFKDMLAANDGSGLKLDAAMKGYKGRTYRLLLEGLKEQSFEYYDDVACRNDDEFDALVAPAVEECFEKSAKLQARYKTDEAKKMVIASFKTWCVDNKAITQAQEKGLGKAREDLMRIIPGCDQFCFKLYHQSMQVDSILENHAQNMKMITFIANGDFGDEDAEDNKKDKSIKASNSQKSITAPK